MNKSNSKQKILFLRYCLDVEIEHQRPNSVKTLKQIVKGIVVSNIDEDISRYHKIAMPKTWFQKFLLLSLYKSWKQAWKQNVAVLCVHFLKKNFVALSAVWYCNTKRFLYITNPAFYTVLQHKCTNFLLWKRFSQFLKEKNNFEKKC